MQNVHFTPPQLATMFKVNVSTIKRWVNKGYIEAEVTAGGHRRVSRIQLEKFIKKNPQYSKSSYVLRRMQKKDICPAKNCWKKYYKCLYNNDTKGSAQLIEKLYLKGIPILNILEHAITPTMRHLSEEWSKNNISVYEEHRMSFMIRMHLIRLDQLVPDKSSIKSPCALLACAPGEFHELPLQLISLIYKLRGWRTHIMGVNVKINDLIKTIKKIKPQVITVSKTYSRKETDAYMNKLTQFTNKQNICLAFGGGAWKKQFNHKKRWTTKKCVHYFPTLRLFYDHLEGYKRK